jgi:hypothetical protein
MAGWMHSRQLKVIDFLREENRVLCEQLGGRRGLLGQEELERHDLAELQVARGDDHTHTILAEDAISLVLASQYISGPHRRAHPAGILAQHLRRCVHVAPEFVSADRLPAT